jgi:uncharacterized Zn-finger protein
MSKSTKIIKIKRNQQSNAACPPPNVELWDMHPKVFLNFDRGDGSAVCPYCQARYELSDE